MEEFILATGNESKYKEFKNMFDLKSDKKYFSKKVFSKNDQAAYYFSTVAKDLDIDKEVDVEETGNTLEENALIKAKGWALATNLVAISDDSGLFINSLDGLPGVKAGRFHLDYDFDYSQLQKEYDIELMDNALCLLELLKNNSDRSGSVQAVLCAYFPQNDKYLMSKGVVDVEISKVPLGENGFCYDFVMLVEYDNEQKTFSQLPKEIKDEISHRALAFEDLYNRLFS